VKLISVFLGVILMATPITAFSAEYKQGDNLPEITITHDRDMTAFVNDVRATAYKEYRMPAAALAADVSVKVSEQLANDLNQGGLGAGVRAYLPKTKEWIEITAISGITATVTRAQPDPDATPTVAADIAAGDPINLIPLDSVPLLSELDPDNDMVVRHTLTSDQTKILPLNYGMDIHYSDGTRRFTVTGDLTITADPNDF
jgi:hypothetical protein